LERVNAIRDQTFIRVVRDAKHLNNLKLKSNREHVKMPTFEESYKAIGGDLYMPEGFIEQEEPTEWPSLRFGDVHLKPHQAVGVHAITKLTQCKYKSAILADDVGTGKTIQVLATVCAANAIIARKLAENNIGKYTFLSPGFGQLSKYHDFDSCPNTPKTAHTLVKS
jgi:SNF2 family DNA or RNA helicase